MAIEPYRTFSCRGIDQLVPWAIAAIATSGLYFGRSVLIPVILAVLLSFLLTPIVAGLRRAKLPRSTAIVLAVLLALGGISAVGLTPEHDAQTAELGYWLSPAYWGRGIATEAAKAVVLFGFDSGSFPYLTSGYFEDNPPSGEVLRKLGFSETGCARLSCLAAGGELPSVRMKLPRLHD